MKDLEIMVEFVQALAEVEDHALVALSPENYRLWDQPNKNSQKAYRETMVSEFARSTDDQHLSSFVVHSPTKEVLCLGLKKEEEWGFLELDGNTRLPLDELFPNQPTTDCETSIKKVLISYTESDESRALAVRDVLIQSGFRVWIAPKGLQPGDRLAAVFKEMEEANHVIVLLSQRAVSSRWVQKEWETAIALFLDRGRPIVIPALLEPIPLPTHFASVRAVVMHGRNFDAGIREIIATCKGEPLTKQSLLSQFNAFLQTFEVLEKEVVKRVDETWRIVQSDYPPRNETQRAVWSNARDTIRRSLEIADCSMAVVTRILEQYDQGEMPRLFSNQQKQQALEWLRGADELTVLFAADLWRLRTGGSGRAGITLNWVFGFLRRTLPDFHGKDYCHDPSQYEWRANELVAKALTLGLLIRSTEVPRGHFEKLDAQSHPSYNFGPNVFFIGKLAAAFLTANPYQTEQLPKGHGGTKKPTNSQKDDQKNLLW